MSEEMKKDMNNENQENKDQAPDAYQHDKEPDKPVEPKAGFWKKAKTFGKQKVLPAAKLVGKGVVTGVSMAGAALGTAYLIGMAIGGYTATKGETKTDSTTDGDQETAATAEKPADPEKTDDVQIVLTESNIQTTEE